jgi:hypothetical protein
MFKILNLVLEDKLELFKFLSLLLKIVDYFFTFPNLRVLLHDLLLLLIDLVLQAFNRVLLLQQMKFFVLDLAFKLLNLSLNLCELILGYLQVSFCFQTHVHDLSQIARIFLFDFLVFRVGILVYLLHHLCVVLLHLLDFLLELLDQQLLLVNKVIMVLHVDIASGSMLLLNLLLGIFKGSPIRHLLLLQVRVQSRITQHLLIVFGLARFQLLVLLLQQQFKLLFVAFLQVLLLVQKLIVLVPSCNGSLGTIFIQGLNDAIELITSHLVVDAGAGWVFETLQLSFQLLPHCFKLLHFLLLG